MHRGVEQIVETSQTRAIAEILKWLVRNARQAGDAPSLAQVGRWNQNRRLSEHLHTQL